MGQTEVLKAINELKFTTFDELRNRLELTSRSITDSLKRLERWQEVTIINFGVRNIYFSQPFMEELITQNE